MRLALREARRASGGTFPNPPVGAVVVRGERVLGRGHTSAPGGPHAEIHAIESARGRYGDAALRGAHLAVTLEPCCHRGRTGPCTRAIVDAGIHRVTVGHRDPHPRVNGGGVAALRRASIEVDEGVLEAECRDQHRGFLHTLSEGRPFVSLKLAATLDGRIATSSGESRWITSATARAYVHRARARSDAILVGSKTVQADDPALTARRGERVVHRPVRIVVDSRLRVPLRSAIFRDDHPETTWVFCGRDAPSRRRAALSERGVRVVPLATRDGVLPIRNVLRAITRQGGPTDILCEGGGVLAAALLKARCVDELLWIAAPTLLGSDGRPALGPLGVGRLAAAPGFEVRRTRRLGTDFLVEARPAASSGRRSR